MGVKILLLGQRHKQLWQFFRQPFYFVDDSILVTEDVLHIFIRLGIEIDAVGVDTLLIQFLHRFVGVLDQELIIIYIDVGRLTVGQGEQ